MAARKISPTGTPGADTAGPALEALDAMMSRYVAWREHAAVATDAYGEWSAAPTSEKAPRFTAYLAALDREEASAGSYAVAVADVERSLPHGLSAMKRAR